MGVRIVEKDKGYRALMARLVEMSRPQISVGVHASDGAEREVDRQTAKRVLKGGLGARARKVLRASGATLKQSRVTVLDVATWAEFGIGQPMRSWLRAWYDEYYHQAQQDIRKQMQSVLAGKKPLSVALDQLGLRFAGLIQRRIAKGIAPPNAPSTIKAKGSSKPLIWWGQFRSSIAHRVKLRR